MRLMTSTTLGASLFVAITLSLPASIRAGSMAGSSTPRTTNVRGATVSSATPASRNPKFKSVPFHRNVPFFVDNPVAQPMSVTIEQTQVAAPPAPKTTSKNRIYVPARWEDTEYGVQVLQPSHWIDLDSAPQY
jgi:hypothetical protein